MNGTRTTKPQQHGGDDDYDTTLWEAAGCGDVERLRAAVESHRQWMDVGNPRRSGMTCLHRASRAGWLAAVELLVQSGSQAIDNKDNNGRTPMHHAAAMGHTEVVERLGAMGSKAAGSADNNHHTPLHLACNSNGGGEMVGTLVRLESTSVNRSDKLGRTCLHAAARRGDVAAINALVQLGNADVNATDHNGDTLIHSAVKHGHVLAIEALVRLGSNAIDTPNKYGYTPVYSAAKNGHVSAIEMLVRLGSIAIDTPNNYGNTPMHAAAKNGQSVMIDALLRLQSNAIDTPNDKNWTPLHAAAAQGHVNSIETLVRLGSKAVDMQDNEGMKPLHLAVTNGHALAIKTLIRSGGNTTALLPGDSNVHGDAIETLVQLGRKLHQTSESLGVSHTLFPIWNARVIQIFSSIEVRSNRYSRLMWREVIESLASLDIQDPVNSNDYMKMIEALVQMGPSLLDHPDSTGMTLLHFAAKEGSPSAAELFLNGGSQALDLPAPWNPPQTFNLEKKNQNVDSTNNEGLTPLMVAARHGRVEIIELLLKNGSKALDMLSNDKWSPMNYAAAHGHEAVLRLLIEGGSQHIDTPNDKGATPMHSAAKNGHIGSMKILLHEGKSTSLDKKNEEDGSTPFLLAAGAGRVDVMRYLIEEAMSEALDVVNNEQETPLHVAAANGQVGAVGYLFELGSRGFDMKDARGWSPVHAATNEGHRDVLRELFKQAGPAKQRCLDARDNEGKTALLITVQKGNFELVKFLLDEGSRASELADQRGKTALHIAADQGNEKMVETLLEALRDAQAKLEAEANNSFFESRVLQALDKADGDGWTPLALAVKSKHEEVAIQLIEAGTDLSAQVGPTQHLTMAAYCAKELPKLKSRCVGMELRKRFNVVTKGLTFKDRDMSNADAATLPLIIGGRVLKWISATTQG